MDQTLMQIQPEGRRIRCTAWVLVAGIAVVGACSDEPVAVRPKAYTSLPASVDLECRNGSAKIFDECGDQVELFSAALARANAEGKVLLVEVGAEWCIWCHVFDAHLNGDRGRFSYTYGEPEQPDARYTRVFTEQTESDFETADVLREFVAAHFVVVHIDFQYAPQSSEVLARTGAADFYQDFLPFVYVVDTRGRFIKAFDHDAVEKRSDSWDWYRGYDRIGMLDQLRSMYEAARVGL